MSNSILYWNAVLLEVSRRDFTPSFVASPDQGGPTRTSRAMAIVHLAMHDAFFGIQGTFEGAAYKTYLQRQVPPVPLPPATAPIDLDAAVAGAASTALRALYPSAAAFLDEAESSAPMGPDATENTNGLAFGSAVGAAILELRSGDGAGGHRPYAYARTYGKHLPDPYNPTAGEVTPHWGDVKHFALPTLTLPGGHVTQAPFPGHSQPNNDYLSDPLYRNDHDEVRRFGGRGTTQRTPDQTMIGNFWGYDGAREVGVPPRLYNQIVRRLAVKRPVAAGDDPVWTVEQCARRFMLANVAMADAGIDAWHWKYHYDLWRPVVGIRHAARSCGPDAVAGMSSVATPGGDHGDPFWAPLGLPRTNQVGAGPATPQFPAYPSGHATFGAALFQVLQRELGEPAITVAAVLACEHGIVVEDATKFDFVSDEQDGHNIDADGSLRTRHVRQFGSFCHAVYENSISRVFLGVHWRFDGLPRNVGQGAVGGVPLGLEIGNQVFDQLLVTA